QTLSSDISEMRELIQMRNAYTPCDKSCIQKLRDCLTQEVGAENIGVYNEFLVGFHITDFDLVLFGCRQDIPEYTPEFCSTEGKILPYIAACYDMEKPKLPPEWKDDLTHLLVLDGFVGKREEVCLES